MKQSKIAHASELDTSWIEAAYCSAFLCAALSCFIKINY